MAQNDTQEEWITQAKARRLDGVLRLLLDALAPLGPLGAQLLWVVQPVSSVFGMNSVLGNLAEALEDPDELKTLRQKLETQNHQDAKDAK